MNDLGTMLPLSGLTVTVADWPAARAAGSLLSFLGAQTTLARRDLARNVALSSNIRHVFASRSTLETDWATCGIAGLTGRVEGPLVVSTGKPATLARAVGLAINLLNGVQLNTLTLLGQRAKILGLCRNGSASAGGAARLMAAKDGWFALNLPRHCDIEMVPALIERETRDDPWSAIANWAREKPVDLVVDRASLLDLAVGSLPKLLDSATACAPWTIAAWPTLGRTPDRPLHVVNLGSLWAGPLCAQLLRRSGMRITDVQSKARPEKESEEFYRVLHHGHATVLCDFSTVEGRSQLASMLHDADVVIEASRPRALRALGVSAETILRDGRARTWIRITGHGQHSNRIAFGDDAAIAGGLVAWDLQGPVFAGDAIADPLTGMLAATAAIACVTAGGSWLVDIAMRKVAQLASAL